MECLGLRSKLRTRGCAPTYLSRTLISSRKNVLSSFNVSQFDPERAHNTQKNLFVLGKSRFFDQGRPSKRQLHRNFPKWTFRNNGQQNTILGRDEREIWMNEWCRRVSIDIWKVCGKKPSVSATLMYSSFLLVFTLEQWHAFSKDDGSTTNVLERN